MELNDGDRSHIRAVLRGDVKRLYMAFDWDESPQGNRYWHDRANKREPLSDADRAYLRGLLGEPEPEPEPDWRTEAAALRAQIADLTRRVEQKEKGNG
jgi:hypothetical protein